MDGSNATLGRFSFNGMTLPSIGPIDVPFPALLTAGEEFEIDCSQLIDNNWLDFISGVYIDNTENDGNLIVRCNGTQQRFPFPATYAGYVPLMVTNPTKIYVTSTETANVIFHFYNIPQFPILLPGPNTPDSNEVNIIAVGGVPIVGGSLPVEIDTSTPLDVNIVTPELVGTEYETIAAGQTDQVLGAAGAIGDLLVGLTIIPATTSPGVVSIEDGGGASIIVFAGGAASVSNLVPFFIPLGINSVAGAWSVTTGANVSVIASGNFT